MLVFAHVVEAGSFSGAGRRLGLAKSSVSKHVAKLEARLGAQLLHRTTRAVALTEVGRAFHDRCARIAREIEEAEREAGRAHASPQGLLKLNVPASLGRLRLAPLIAEFLAEHPKVRVDVALDERFVNAVEGGFDVTVRVTRALDDSSLIARRLAPTRIVVCGAPSYLRERGVPRTPAELARHECLSYSHARHEAWRFAGCAADVEVAVAGRFRANDGDALREAALAGMGLAQVPEFIVAPELTRGALQAVLEPYEVSSCAIWALYPPSRYLSPNVRAFVDLLARRLCRS
jgi:DNA-binding transcriptional LysR family regulator